MLIITVSLAFISIITQPAIMCVDTPTKYRLIRSMLVCVYVCVYVSVYVYVCWLRSRLFFTVLIGTISLWGLKRHLLGSEYETL